MAGTVNLRDLGLTEEDINLIHDSQRDLAAHGSSSSRAASRASSGGQLLLDSGSLAQLGRHFERLMQHIQTQLARLSEQVEVVTMHMENEAGYMVDNADAEIARYHSLLQQMEELDLDFDRISNIKDIVKTYKKRAEDLEREIERSQSSRHKHHHGHKKDKKDKGR